MLDKSSLLYVLSKVARKKYLEYKKVLSEPNEPEKSYQTKSCYTCRNTVLVESDSGDFPYSEHKCSLSNWLIKHSWGKPCKDYTFGPIQHKEIDVGYDSEYI